MDWPKHVAESILPLSRERDDLARALHEWYCTGQVTDLEQSVEACQLCGQSDIRYQLEIQNRHTIASLLIGSECIKQFDISAVDEEGMLLDRAASDEHEAVLKLYYQTTSLRRRLDQRRVETGKAGAHGAPTTPSNVATSPMVGR